MRKQSKSVFVQLRNNLLKRERERERAKQAERCQAKRSCWKLGV